MKKSILFLIFLVVAISLNSCTELDDNEIIELTEAQAVEKDKVDPPGGEEEPEDIED